MLSLLAMKIGILGFQGAVVEHQQHIEKIGEEAVVVRYPGQLDDLDGIILPGGESTTMGKLLNRTGMMEPLKEKILQGLPVWGTCAGMILLAKNLVNDSVRHLAVMDIEVKRNAYGTQIDSFDMEVSLPEISNEAGTIGIYPCALYYPCRRRGKGIVSGGRPYCGCQARSYVRHFFSSGAD